MALGWSEGTWSGGPFGEGGQDAVANVTGVIFSGSIGTSVVSAGAIVGVTGVYAVGSLGEEEPIVGNGWGANAWGFSGWGGILVASVDVIGVEATTALGTVSEVIGKVNVVLTGVQGNTALGEDEIDGDANAVVSGVSASSSVNSVTVFGKAVVNVTGVAGTVSLGQVTQASSNTVQVTGLLGTISLGSVAINGDASVILTGVSASGRVAGPLVWGLIDTSQSSNFSGINTSQTPNWVPIAA